ncbi:MAG: hypothetical protein FWH41_05060 [Treponema sp.]|nr:hypothetical protein [Treponema sp.]
MSYIQKNIRSVYDESPIYTFYKALTVSTLRPATIRCVKSVLYNFFFRQYKASLLPGRVPVTLVDHQLDEKIPFVPSWVNIYLDFTFFWVRMLGFFLHKGRRKYYHFVRDFIDAIGKMYSFAAESYKKNFSTTKRPFYIKRPRFFLIHLVDPHLMCIPSLHVMIAIFTYTKFKIMLCSNKKDENNDALTEEMRQGALGITRAILFVKQHSINCIAAALYAMTCFDQTLFPVHEMEKFAEMLFDYPLPAPLPENPIRSKTSLRNSKVRPGAAPLTVIPATDAEEIKAHIISLYRHFLEGKKNAPEKGWEEPLLSFMRSLPRKVS